MDYWEGVLVISVWLLGMGIVVGICVGISYIIFATIEYAVVPALLFAIFGIPALERFID